MDPDFSVLHEIGRWVESVLPVPPGWGAVIVVLAALTVRWLRGALRSVLDHARSVESKLDETVNATEDVKLSVEHLSEQVGIQREEQQRQHEEQQRLWSKNAALHGRVSRVEGFMEAIRLTLGYGQAPGEPPEHVDSP